MQGLYVKAGEREMDFSAKERDLTEREKALSERERVSTDERERGRDREREMYLIIYDILRTRNAISLRYLLEEYEVIFDRFLTDFVSQISPLHIAIQHRSVGFAREILHRKPQLAHVLSSQGFSPLRMASANGSVDIVREILLLIADVSDDRDSKGWTPVHAAAMKGHLDVLEEFNGTNTEWIRDTTDRDETVLHLCVKYNKRDALKMLILLVGPDNEFVNRKDVNGNTILHLAAMKKDKWMIRYLSTKSTGVEINAMNMNGLTALDVFAPCSSNSADKDMVKELRKKGAERSREMSTENQLKNVLILVGTLTATLSFQATLVPPGGLWQDDLNMGFNNTLNNKNSHTAGTSILADKQPKQFHIFQSFNLLVFFMSVFLILIGVSPVKPVYREKIVSPMLQILPLLALTFVSMMIYLCNNVHTPKGLPRDIGWELNASNLIFFACSLFICFLVSIFYSMRQ